MATEQKLTFLIEAKNMATEAINNVSKSLDGLKDKNGSLAPAIEKVGVVAGVAFGSLSALAYKAFSDFAESEAQMTIANNNLSNSIKGLSATQLKSITGFKDGGQALTSLKEKMESVSKAGIKLGFDDEATAQSFSKLFSITKDTTLAQKDLTLAMDLARNKNIELSSAVEIVSKMHSGSAKELTNWGMAVKDGMTYAEMFAEVNKKVGGTALAMSETAGMKMQILKLQMGDLSENIGGALAPAFSQLLEKITPVVDKIAKWVEKNPELSANIIGISLAITGLLVVLATLSAILPAISLGFALLSSPIGITILIIGGLVGAIYYLYTSWDQIMKDLLLIWEAFKEGLKVILFAIQNEWIRWVNYLSMKYNLFITEIKAMWDSIKDYFVNVLNTIKSAWDTVWSGAKQSVIDVWEGIKSTIGEGIAWIETQIQKITNAFNSIKNSVSSAMASSATTTTAAYGGGGPGLISYFRATGGQVNPSQSYIVGENGPELFSPSSFGSISKAGSFGGTPIIINISNNSFLGKEGIAEEIGNGLMNILKQNIKLV